MIRSFSKLFQPALQGMRCRLLSNAAQPLTDGEQKILQILKEKFPKASFVHVQDISGGCGAMYDVQIEAPDFAGKRTVMQHRMVNEALADEIKTMHGLRINTRSPAS